MRPNKEGDDAEGRDDDHDLEDRLVPVLVDVELVPHDFLERLLLLEGLWNVVVVIFIVFIVIAIDIAIVIVIDVAAAAVNAVYLASN